MFFVFMFLGSIALWITLTSLIFWLRSRARKKSEGAWDFNSIALTLVAVLWLFGSFWYAGGQKLCYDAVVRVLCAKDGGIKVYETVTLPADRFDAHGNVNVPSERSAKPTDEYYFEMEDEYLKTGNPSVRRRITQFIRRSDKKVLGERIQYERGGGDLPLPGQPSSFSCPPLMESRLEASIFKKGM